MADLTGSVPVPDPTKLTTDAVNAATAQWRRDLAGVQELLETRIGGDEAQLDRLWSLFNGLPDRFAAQASDTRDVLAEADRSLREIIEQRLDGNDKAIELAAQEISKIRSLLVEDVRARMDAEREFILGQIANAIAEVARVEAVMAERFTAIEGTFASNALALTAALAAQKEAAAEAKKSSDLSIDRANSTTKETIASNAAQTTAGLASQAATIADLKDRVVRIESGGLATRAAGADRQQADTFTQTDRIAATTQAAAREAATRAAIISGVAVLVAIAAILFAAIHG